MAKSARKHLYPTCDAMLLSLTRGRPTMAVQLAIFLKTTDVGACAVSIFLEPVYVLLVGNGRANEGSEGRAGAVSSIGRGGW